MPEEDSLVMPMPLCGTERFKFRGRYLRWDASIRKNFPRECKLFHLSSNVGLLLPGDFCAYVMPRRGSLLITAGEGCRLGQNRSLSGSALLRLMERRRPVCSAALAPLQEAGQKQLPTHRLPLLRHVSEDIQPREESSFCL